MNATKIIEGIVGAAARARGLKAVVVTDGYPQFDDGHCVDLDVAHRIVAGNNDYRIAEVYDFLGETVWSAS